jgi:alpha-tubulin suppressor-like RCC1 family protein
MFRTACHNNSRWTESNSSRDNRAIDNLKQLFCWGFGGSYQLGQGQTNSSDIPIPVDTTYLEDGDKTFTYVAVGGDHSCAITESQKLLCFGRGLNGRLGNNDTAAIVSPNAAKAVDQSMLSAGESFVKVAIGYKSTCALTNLGFMYCFGDDSESVLGNGSATDDRLVPTLVEGINPWK